jgi:hypothetical protein
MQKPQSLKIGRGDCDVDEFRQHVMSEVVRRLRFSSQRLPPWYPAARSDWRLRRAISPVRIDSDKTLIAWFGLDGRAG